jgi:iron complex transport system permease protein
MKKPGWLWTMAALTPLCLGLCMLAGSSGFGYPRETILYLRATRVAAGFAVGAGLSCAGVVMQALLRNPLAEPYVLGISSGAGVGAAMAILSGITAWSVFALPLSAFLCSALTLALVYALARVRGRLSVYSLILSGVIVGSVCSSALMFMLTLADTQGLHNIMWWMLGNLETPSDALLFACAALILAGSASSFLLANELNALSLGSEIAHHVGVRTRLSIFLGLVLSTLITAASVSTAGLIGFVGLIVPHAVRSLVGADHRTLIPAAALSGGVFLAVCDAIARTLLAPQEIPVGVITALIGGPFFLVILRKRRKEQWTD